MNGDVKTKIIKRNGEEVTFDIDKIINAITKANEEVSKLHQMNEYQIMAIAEKVADQVKSSSHAVNVTLPVNSVIKANAVIIYFFILSIFKCMN